MVNNQFSCVYKITNQFDDQVYIGSTKNNLQTRLQNHKTTFNNGGAYCSSHELFKKPCGTAGTSVELIEMAPRASALQRERHWIHHYGDRAVNKNRNPGLLLELGQVDYSKRYFDAFREEHNARMKLRMREYYEANKELIRERSRLNYQLKKQNRRMQQVFDNVDAAMDAAIEMLEQLF